MRKNLFCLLFAALALCGCKKDDEDVYNDTRQTPYLISVYAFINAMSVRQYEALDGGSDINVIEFKESIIRASRNSEKEQHSYFSNLYGDTSYTGYTFGFSCPALAYPFDKITMSCNSDFDDEHLAGEPLDDIVQLKFGSFWEFIQNGYEYPDGCERPDPVDIPLTGEILHSYLFSEIERENSKLISLRKPLIHFTSSPATPGEYTFTLELTTNGETFTTTFTQKFE